MAYNISDDELAELVIKEPSYCLFYHREHLRQLLPSMAEAYLLVGKLQKELTEKLQQNMGE
jgi:hypothetical protein